MSAPLTENPKSILNAKFFKEVEPYFRCAHHGRNGNGDLKIDIEPPPQPLLAQLLKFKTTCIQCHRTHHPFRPRQKPTRDHVAALTKHIYYACSCGELGCARGNAARDEYAAVGRYFLEGNAAKPAAQQTVPTPSTADFARSGRYLQQHLPTKVSDQHSFAARQDLAAAHRVVEWIIWKGVK